MPKVSERFTAYPVTVTLDGVGAGTIVFQAVGQNLVITNIYGSVATQTFQAKATVSKGQVGAQWSLVNSNSGSTGFNANGTISLLDGESLYVAWSGGDAGATATATFTGVVAPFDDVRKIIGTFSISDPIAAGDGSLIYPGLQSFDYVVGVRGWRIARNGDVDFNAGTFRGRLSIRRVNDGRGVVIDPFTGNTEFYTTDSTSGAIVLPGLIFSGLTDNPGVSQRGSLFISSPNINGNDRASIQLASANYVTGAKSFINLNENVTVDGTLSVGGVDVGKGFKGENSFVGNSAASAVEAEVFNVTPTTAFEPNRLYRVDYDGRINQTIAGNGPQIKMRENTIAGTIFLTNGRLPVNGNVEYCAPPPVYFKTGATVTSTSVSVTLTASAGTAQWQGPRGASIWDVGLASYRPNVPTLT